MYNENLRYAIVALLLLAGFTGFANKKKSIECTLTCYRYIPQESVTIGIIGGDINLTNSYAPELDFTYFFAINFSAELILGTVRHMVSMTASDLSAIGGDSSANVNLGRVCRQRLRCNTTRQPSRPLNRTLVQGLTTDILQYRSRSCRTKYRLAEQVCIC